MTHKQISFFVLSLLFTSSAFTHHGKKYLLTGSYELPAPGTLHALFSMEHQPRFDERAYGIEPGILYGISKFWDVEAHAHFSNEEGAFRTEAVAIESRLGLLSDYSEKEEETGSDSHSSFGMALLVEIEKGFSDHKDNIEGRFIVGGEHDVTSYALNLLWQRTLTDEAEQDVRYVIGLRWIVAPNVGVGVEFDGPFDDLKNSHLTPGLFFSVADKIDLKIGASFHLHAQPEEPVFRMALVFGL